MTSKWPAKDFWMRRNCSTRRERVAKQHFALRSQQLDTYSKTSTLARAVKNQTDRVTLTVRAAVALAGRFNEAGTTHQSTYASPARSRPEQAQPVPGRDAVGQEKQSQNKKEGLRQDHHYERFHHIGGQDPCRGRI